MANGNPQLEAALAQRAEGHDILEALVNGGVLLVIGPDETLLAGQFADGGMAVAAFTSPDKYQTLEESERLQQADAATLLEIASDGEVTHLVINPDNDDTAVIPFEDLAGYLTAHGITLASDGEIEFGRSENERVPEIRQAVERHLPAFPLVNRVWISDTRMPTGASGLMFHIDLADGTDPDVANDFLHTVMDDAPDPGEPVFAHLADEETEELMNQIDAELVSR